MSNDIVETIIDIIKTNSNHRSYPMSIIYNSVQEIYDTIYVSPLNELECLLEFIESFEPSYEDRMLNDNEIQSIATWLVEYTIRGKDTGKSPLKTIFYLVDGTDNVPLNVNNTYGSATVYDEVLIMNTYLNRLDDFGLPNNIVTNQNIITSVQEENE